MINILENMDKECTGCSACMNICPKDAISMQLNENGYIMPIIDNNLCIDCNQCKKACPVNNIDSINVVEPDKLYAINANDNKILLQSSSGGMFSLLSEIVFQKNGYVCGASFDENMVLSHKLVNNKNDLLPLKGSKYVQSNINLIFRDIKKLLINNIYVLFTGTPCQVNALKSYLGKDYDCLITMEFLCHGVPPQSVLHRYLDENFKNRKIKDIQFRNKKHGWSCIYMDITFLDGETISYRSGDLGGEYETGFQKNVFLRSTCYNCHFAGIANFKSQADFRVGDFWGIKDLNESLYNKNGVSVCMTCTQKAVNLLDEIEKIASVKESNIAPVDYIRNRIKKKYSSVKRQEYFFSLAKNRTVSESVNMIMENKHDIGLVGNFAVPNFGGTLTYYALYKTLVDNGYSTLMIECRIESEQFPADKYAWRYKRVPELFMENPYPMQDLAERPMNKAKLKNLIPLCNAFVVGSDQQFNNDLYNRFGKTMILDWVTDNKPKIVYAASFGHDYIWGPDSDRATMSHFMKKFDAISVREKSGVDVMANEFNCDATWVLDPVFLCDVKHYEELVLKGTHSTPEHPFIFSYVLDINNTVIDALSYYSEKLNYPIKAILSDGKKAPKTGWNFDTLVKPKNEEWLAHIKNCKFMITDSFHGVCFAIIFKKPFVAIVNKLRGETRFTSVLHTLNLQSRMIYDANELLTNSKLFEEIDYKKTYKILDKEKNLSLKWLLNALETSKNKKTALSTFDIIDGRCDFLHGKIDRNYDELLNEINNLKKIVEELSKTGSEK